MQMRFTLRCVQCMATSVFWGPMKKMLGGQKFASDTEVQSVSHSSVAWTAASIVLCIGHSEAC